MFNRIFEINQNIIQIYNNIDIQSFRQNFIDVNLKNEKTLIKSKNKI